MIKILVVFVLTALIFTGCSNSRYGEGTSDNITEVSYDNELTSDDSMENSREEQLLDKEDYWSDEELMDNGQYMYKGFTLDAVRIDGTDYRRLTSESGICILEKISYYNDQMYVGKGNIIIRNGDTTAEYELGTDIGRKNNKHTGINEPTVYQMDVTGNGKEELVIYIPYEDMGMRDDKLFIYDTESLSQIPIVENISEYIADQVESIDNIQLKDSGIECTINFKDGRSKACLGSSNLLCEEENIEYLLPSGYNFYKNSNDRIYYISEVVFRDSAMRESIRTANIKLRVRLKYDSETDMFIPEGDVEVVDD